MILQIIKTPLLLVGAAVLSSSLAYGQATIAPVVPPTALDRAKLAPFPG